jgi:hypothetical protein
LQSDPLEWFVYTLCDPRAPDLVRYVGWTKNPTIRYQAHLARARIGKDRTRCGKWKRALILEGLHPTMAIVERGTGPWEAVERKWISHFRQRSGSKLTNLTDGGEGTPGRHWVASEARREQMRIASTGRRHTSETKTRISQAKRGIPRSPEHVESAAQPRRGQRRSSQAVANSAAGHRGLHHTEEARAKLREHHAKLRTQPRPAPQRTEESRKRTSTSLKAFYASNPKRVTSQETKDKIRVALLRYRKRA